MRSVFVFTDAAADVLNALLPVDETEADRVVQTVTIEDPPEWTDGWDDPHRLHQITKRFGHLPKRLVIVDISGRVEGRREALDVVDAIRGLGTTAVFDDWSTSPWSDEELERGQTHSGRHFLSCRLPSFAAPITGISTVLCGYPRTQSEAYETSPSTATTPRRCP